MAGLTLVSGAGQPRIGGRRAIERIFFIAMQQPRQHHKFIREEAGISCVVDGLLLRHHLQVVVVASAAP